MGYIVINLKKNSEMKLTQFINKSSYPWVCENFNTIFMLDDKIKGCTILRTLGVSNHSLKNLSLLIFLYLDESHMDKWVSTSNLGIA